MKYALMLSCLLLAACASDNKKDYAASARCHELGLKAGTDEFNQCMRDEKASQMLKQQREEYEQNKQEQMDWKLRGY